VIQWQGETLTVEQAAERTGLPVDMIERRLQRGWTAELIMTRPESAGPHTEERKAETAREAQKGFALVGGGIALFAVFLFVTCTSSTGKFDPCKRTAEAFTMGNSFIERELRSPGTAEFASILDAKITPLPRGENCAFRIVTYVDAQNAFGGTVREHFALEVEPETPSSNSWKLNTISTF
jgi:hypothetical protein